MLLDAGFSILDICHSCENMNPVEKVLQYHHESVPMSLNLRGEAE